MSNRTITTGAIWAEGAPNVPTSGEPTTGVTYANSNLTSEAIQTAWPFKSIADSANFNEMMKRITYLMQQVEASGILIWCASTDYLLGALCRGSNGVLYESVDANSGNDPVTDTEHDHWAVYSSKYLPFDGVAVNSSQLQTLEPGNDDGCIPVSNGTLCVNLNAEMVGGKQASFFQPVPPGTVFHTAQQTAPDGYLSCDGSQVSRTTYSALFAAIGTLFGAGNGSTTFNIPDIRGEFIRGWDTGGSLDAGRAFGSIQEDALQNITGQIQQDDQELTIASGAFRGASSASGPGQNGGGTGGVTTFDASRVARTSTETRPHNIALLAIIKY